jgi:hypothetical protein
MKIENHIDVYVDEFGRVCMAQPSMDERCGVALEPEEAKALIILLTDALNEAVAISGNESVAAAGNDGKRLLRT